MEGPSILHSIEANHVLHALIIGTVAGILAVVIDSFVLSKVESTIGLTPTAF